MDVKALSGRFFVAAEATYRGTGTRGNVSWQRADPEGDLEVVEGAVRHAIARLVAQSFASGTDVTVHGRTVSGTLRDESNRVFVPLDGWAAARGVALTQNVRLGTVRFTVGARNLILALGTDRYKVDGEPRSLGAMLVRRGAKWYVPLGGIEQAIR